MSDERSVPEHSGVAVVGGPAKGAPVDDEHSESDDDERGPWEPPRHRARARTAGSGAAGTPRWLVPVLSAVTIVSVLFAVVFGVKWSNLNAQNSTRATVQRVAQDFLSALTNFTPHTVDADFRTISTYATGDFAKQSNQFFGSSIRQRLEQAQAWSRGQQRYLYVQSLDGSQAQVYSEIDQTYANNKVTTPVTDVLQVVLALSDTSSGWKISTVTVLQPPSSTSAPTGNASSATGGK